MAPAIVAVPIFFLFKTLGLLDSVWALMLIYAAVNLSLALARMTADRFELLLSQRLVLRDLGADLLVVPAAFTAVTGEAHWQVLLRARAIENQCLVIGAGQGGRHSPTR